MAAISARRDELLRVAAGLIAASGYAGTSLRDVAEAAGIQAGSIYHHFDSKEMLAVELVRAFHHDLDTLSRAWSEPSPEPLAAIHDFAHQVAALADRHRAAVFLCMFDAPSTAGGELRSIVRSSPQPYRERWSDILQDAVRRGQLRPEVDVAQLLAVLGDAVLDLGYLLGVRASRTAVASLTELLLHGVARQCPPDAALDASMATAVAMEAIEGWRGAQRAPAGSARREQVLAAASQEFARRGYEATTVRDIAETAGMRVSSMYRHFDSKQAMLRAIIGNFSEKLLTAYQAVVESTPSAVEALDALMRLMCSATDFFPHEFSIMRDWWRTVDAQEPDRAVADNTARMRLLRTVIQRGVDSGEFVPPARPRVFPLALRDVLWFPVQDVVAVSTDQRFRFLRMCVLRGARSPQLSAFASESSAFASESSAFASESSAFASESSTVSPDSAVW